MAATDIEKTSKNDIMENRDVPLTRLLLDKLKDPLDIAGTVPSYYGIYQISRNQDDAISTGQDRFVRAREKVRAHYMKHK